jgi:SNF2 family DNA or RNA helicase
MKQKYFTEFFDGLEAYEQKVLVLIAMCYELTNKSSLLKMGRLCGIRVHNDRALNNTNLGIVLKDLTEKHHALIKQRYGYLAHDKILTNLLPLCPKLAYYEEFKEAINEVKPFFGDTYHYYSVSEEQQFRLIREFRFALFEMNQERIEALLVIGNDLCKKKPILIYTNALYGIYCHEFLDLIPPAYCFECLKELSKYSRYYLNSADSYIQSIQTLLTEGEILKQEADYRLLLADNLLFTGKFAEAKNAVSCDKVKPEIQLAVMAAGNFLKGNIKTAIKQFKSSFATLKTVKRAEKAASFFPFEFLDYLFLLCAVTSREFETEDLELVITTYKKKDNIKHDVFFPLMEYYQGNTSVGYYIDILLRHDKENRECDIFPSFIITLSALWLCKKELNDTMYPLYMFRMKKLYNCGNYMISYFYACLLEKLIPQNADVKHVKETFKGKYIIPTVLFKQIPPWKGSLKKLASLAAATQQTKEETVAKQQEESRLVWFVHYSEYDHTLVFMPKEQRKNKTGKWLKGRPVALKRLKYNELECMTDQDRQIAKYICEESYSRWNYYSKKEYNLDHAEVAPLFIGHPNLFLEESYTTPVQLVKGELQLLLQEAGSKLKLSFSEDFDIEGNYVIKETATRYRVVVATEMHMKIRETFNDSNELIIPKEGADDLKSIITGLSSLITVHSDTQDKSGTAEVIDADCRPHIHLLPVGEGLHVEFYVRPFYDTGSYIKPGHGGSSIMTELNGKPTQAKRNLQKEEELALDVIKSSTILAGVSRLTETVELISIDDCLILIRELQELEDKVVVEWPEGEKLKLKKQLSFKDLNLAAKKKNDWFELTGQLKIDNKQVLEMSELLALLANNKSRFIELGNNEFIELTEAFKKRLEELGSHSFTDGSHLRIHPLSAALIHDRLADFGKLTLDSHWKKQVKRLDTANTFQPAVPSTFQAELRDYQLEGFNWMSRLAAWGVGACLADDMGLGKTIQALALILDQAIKGPSLVIAPSSVCSNWLNEAVKFAPSLKPALLIDGNREAVISQAGSFDLVICSYGLLIQEEKSLEKVNWQTVVLDEAQAIKNFRAKRTKAAMKLKSNFRLITTGTPVENHLTEFWSLFNFINPGFLGTREQFTEKFVKPMESQTDHTTKHTLRKMIQPFMLRRSKTQVLDELPSKTEITLSVDLSDQESAFYEALRQKAVQQVENDESKPGAKHLKILAELTRLRQACCHPALINRDLELSSSKLALFSDVVGELLDGNHKVLVFSQFVSYLSIIRDYCDEKKYTYQYLDGSVPQKERQKRIDAFQAGFGDLFLISLKAGGTGLNLTAADYVIHMDPWWNPAVEDQASDRAHRIGQQRPVTIYRLVTQGTIEEKIVNLHKQKRDLADSLLEGTDIAGKLSVDDLLALMKEN